jgi:hypothetical protein
MVINIMLEERIEKIGTEGIAKEIRVTHSVNANTHPLECVFLFYNKTSFQLGTGGLCL